MAKHVVRPVTHAFAAAGWKLFSRRLGVDRLGSILTEKNWLVIDLDQMKFKSESVPMA
jgi:hypothetical protein